MKKTYKNVVSTLDEAYVILESFVSTMDEQENKNFGYRFRINKKDDSWVVKMFLDEKETLDKVFGQHDKPPTVL